MVSFFHDIDGLVGKDGSPNGWILTRGLPMSFKKLWHDALS
jgi:hypothetical protein